MKNKKKLKVSTTERAMAPPTIIGTKEAVSESGRIACFQARAFAFTSSQELKDSLFSENSKIVGFSPCKISGTKRYLTVKGLMRINSSLSVAPFCTKFATMGERE